VRSISLVYNSLFYKECRLPLRFINFNSVNLDVPDYDQLREDILRKDLKGVIDV